MIRVFPNNTSAMRLIGALLAEKYYEWQQACRYFDMTDYWEFKKEKEQQENKNNNNVTKLTKIN